jgi:hypothetical protein
LHPDSIRTGGKLVDRTRPAIYLGPARENVGHHHVCFPNTEAISETWDVFFDLSDRVEFEDWDVDEELVAPPPPVHLPETRAYSVVDPVEMVPVDMIQDLDLDDDEDDVASPSL